MAVDVIVDMQITDPAAFARYPQLAGPILAKHGGKLLAAGSAAS